MKVLISNASISQWLLAGEQQHNQTVRIHATSTNLSNREFYGVSLERFYERVDGSQAR